MRIKIRRDRSSSSTCRSIHRPAATRVTPTSIVTTILFLRFCRPWECRVERTGRVALAAGPTHLWPPGPTLTVHLRYAVCGRRRGISEKSRCKAVVQQQKKKKTKDTPRASKSRRTGRRVPARVRSSDTCSETDNGRGRWREVLRSIFIVLPEVKLQKLEIKSQILLILVRFVLIFFFCKYPYRLSTRFWFYSL